MDQNPPNPPGNIPHPSATFGNVPNASENFRTVPNPAEPFGTVPPPAESFRSVPTVSERKQNHTLTVREAARLFEAAGVARTERSIVNWCQPNRTGIARLDSYFDPNERKYYLTHESVERAIAEEKAKATKAPETAEIFGTLPNPTERSADRQPAQTEDSGDRTRELEKEVTDLKITNRGKDYFIEQLKEEREFFAAERQKYVADLMSFNRKVGELETRLLQIEPPSRPQIDEPQN